MVLGGPVGGRIKQQGNKDYTDQQVMQSIIYGPLRTQFHLMTFKVIKSLKSQYLDLDQSNHIFGCSMFQLENDDFIAIHSAVASGGPHPPVNHSRIKKAWPETLRCHHSHMNHFLSGELP